MEEQKYLMLETELQGLCQGAVCEVNPYRARLIFPEGRRREIQGHQTLFQVGQTFKDGSIGWTGPWRLATLLESFIRNGKDNDLYIDAGQDWKVIGVRAVLVEAVQKVNFIPLEEG